MLSGARGGGSGDQASHGKVSVMSYWWCLKHSRVESDKDTCALTDRLGPYGSEAEATGALASARARTEAEDARDKADDDWGSA